MNTVFLQVFKVLLDDFPIQFAEGGQSFKTRRFGKIGFQFFYFLFIVRHMAAIPFQDGDIFRVSSASSENVFRSGTGFQLMDFRKLSTSGTVTLKNSGRTSSGFRSLK